MKSFEYVINDAVGIHARPAGLLAKEAKKFPGNTVHIVCGDKEVDVTRLMSVMGMGIKCGTAVTFVADGPDEDTVIEAIKTFVEANL